MSKVRLPLLPDDIFINYLSPNISPSSTSTFDLLGFGIVEEGSFYAEERLY